MLDRETAERAIEDLELLVDQVLHSAAGQRVVLDGQPRWTAIAALISAGQDIAVLASAIGVLARRSENSPLQADRYPRGL